AVGDASRREERVVRLHQVIHGQHGGGVQTLVAHDLPLVLVARPDTRLHVATQGLERTGGDYTLGRAADAQQQIDTGVRHSRHQRPGDITIGDELDARTGPPNLGHDLIMTRPIQNDDGDVLHAKAGGLRDALDVLRYRALNVDRVSS